MSKRSKARWIGGASFLVLLFLSFWLKFSLLTFEMKNTLYWSSEKTFSLNWIHSVEKEEWIEFYEKKEKTIYLSSTKFKTFGAGVPSTPNDGKDAEVKDGFVEMKIGRTFSSLQLIVSKNVRSTLIINDKEVLLYEITGDYEPVTISVQKMTLWELLTKGEKL